MEKLMLHAFFFQKKTNCLPGVDSNLRHQSPPLQRLGYYYKKVVAYKTRPLYESQITLAYLYMNVSANVYRMF